MNTLRFYGTAAVAGAAKSHPVSTAGIRANRAIRVMVIDLLRIGRTGYYRERKRLSIIILKAGRKRGEMAVNGRPVFVSLIQEKP